MVLAVELEGWWHADDEWTGWILRDSVADLLKGHVFVTWLAGSAHYEAAQGVAFAPGRPLTVLPDPDNPYDPLAMAVFDEAGQALGGHIPRVVAKGVPR